MKNPFRSERGTLTSGRACAVYALAFVLMLFLDATRFSSFLDRAGIDFPPAAVVGQTVKGVAEATGLAAFLFGDGEKKEPAPPEWEPASMDETVDWIAEKMKDTLRIMQEVRERL